MSNMIHVFLLPRDALRMLNFVDASGFASNVIQIFD